MIREIATIKESKPFIEEINTLTEKINQKKQEKYKAGLGLTELKDSHKELKGNIEKLKKN